MILLLGKCSKLNYFKIVVYPANEFGALIGGDILAEYRVEYGDVTLTRYPIELIPFVEFHNFRFGLGLTQHTNIEFEDDTVFETSVDGEDATGTVILLEYLFQEHLALGLRIVDVDYEFSAGGYSETFDAGHVGISAAWLF